MKPTYQHKLLTSFYMWFDHYLLLKGDAYQNFDTDLFNYSDEQITDKTVFGSPYKQWVYDKSVRDATLTRPPDNIPGVPVIYGGEGEVLSPGTSGLIVDYENGRVLFDDTVTPGSPGMVTAKYSVKNFNTYVSNQDEESLIIAGKHKLNARYITGLETYIPPYDEVVPAAFLSATTTNNEPFALGGEDNTVSQISAVCFAENIYQLDGILSIFADASKEVFHGIPYSGSPLDEFGDIKSSYSSGYDYNNVANNFATDISFIQNTTVSKISDRMDKFIPVPLYVGFIDFEINKYRFPRQ